VSQTPPPAATGPSAPEPATSAAVPASAAEAEARQREAADRLLARAPAPEYLEAWARSLTRTLFDAGAKDERAAVLFRLGEDLYAVDATFVREVHRPRRVHRVPGRTNEIFRGLVSLRGELVLCADLHVLLGADRPARPPSTARVVRVEKDGQGWAFEVDELLDVRRYDAATLAQPQVTVSKAAVHFTDALLKLTGGGVERHAARLDAERFFAGLARSLT